MVTQSESVVRAKRKSCAICSADLEAAIDLPGLPLTDTYCREPIENSLPGIDQRLLYCPGCGHGQLEIQIAPEVLYGTNYCFRTSASVTARKGTQFFMSVLEEVASGRHFRCVLDLGCNDLYLLSQLKGRADVRIGIDPVWKGCESDREDASILVYGSSIEDVDLSMLPEKPDLVVCRHTLEHVFDPGTMLNLLLESAAPDALFVFEVPGFDGLISRFRFDQIFHQHLQYFSFASFARLLDNVGARCLLSRENYHDWGAMAVVFVRSASANVHEADARRPSLSDIHNRYHLFRQQMMASSAMLSALSGTTIYGYGAAQMLPVLAYHMKTDFGQLAAVLDDDPAKDGIQYWNLPVKVMLPGRVKNISEASVLVTAVDNVQPIMTKLLANRPRHILYPFHVI